MKETLFSDTDTQNAISALPGPWEVLRHTAMGSHIWHSGPDRVCHVDELGGVQHHQSVWVEL